MRKKIRNLHVPVEGGVCRQDGSFTMTRLNCIITNDEIGKTLSIGDGNVQFTIPFEAVERYLK